MNFNSPISKIQKIILTLKLYYFCNIFVIAAFEMSSKLALPNLATITEGLEQDNFLYENQFVSPVLAGDEADDESDLHRKSSFRVLTLTISCSLI